MNNFPLYMIGVVTLLIATPKVIKLSQHNWDFDAVRQTEAREKAERDAYYSPEASQKRADERYKKRYLKRRAEAQRRTILEWQARNGI